MGQVICDHYTVLYQEPEPMTLGVVGVLQPVSIDPEDGCIN